MTRQIIWIPWDGPGAEHVHLAPSADGLAADGLAVGLAFDLPLRVVYRIVCDGQWATRLVRVALLDGSGVELALESDGAGHWRDALGDRTLPQLDGCLDVDLGFTPLTNTLPIKRLHLEQGHSAEIAVAMIAPHLIAPEQPEGEPALTLRIARAPQRYTCLEDSPGGTRVRFESLSSDFSATLTLDADALVVEYPGLFVRAWAR
jgi:hypothetical protein